jgi:hypothetical protein
MQCKANASRLRKLRKISDEVVSNQLTDIGRCGKVCLGGDSHR